MVVDLTEYYGCDFNQREQEIFKKSLCLKKGSEKFFKVRHEIDHIVGVPSIFTFYHVPNSWGLKTSKAYKQ